MFKIFCLTVLAVILVRCQNEDLYYVKYLEDIKTASSLEEFAKKHNVNVTLLLVKNDATFYDIHYSHPYQKNENAFNLGDVKHEDILKQVVYGVATENIRIAHSRDYFLSLEDVVYKSKLYVPLFEISSDFDSLNIQGYADASYIFCTDPFNIFQQENETELCHATVNQVEYDKDGGVIKNITTYEENHLYDYVISDAAPEMPYYEQVQVLKLFKQALKRHGSNTQEVLSALVELLQKKFSGYIWSVLGDIGDAYAVDADKFVEIVNANDEKKKYLVHSYKI